MHEYFASKTFSNFNSELMCMFENRFLKIMIMANLNSLSGSYSMTFWRSRWWFCFNFCRFVKLCFWNSCPGTLTSQQNGYFSELKTWVWFFCVCVWSTNISVSFQVRYFMEALRGRVQSHPEANVTRQNTKKRKGKEVVV